MLVSRRSRSRGGVRVWLVVGSITHPCRALSSHGMVFGGALSIQLKWKCPFSTPRCPNPLLLPAGHPVAPSVCPNTLGRVCTALEGFTYSSFISVSSSISPPPPKDKTCFSVLQREPQFLRAAPRTKVLRITTELQTSLNSCLQWAVSV